MFQNQSAMRSKYNSAIGDDYTGSGYSMSNGGGMDRNDFSKPKSVQKLPWEVEPSQKVQPTTNKLSSYRVSNSVSSNGSVSSSGRPSRINSGSAVPMFEDENDDDSTPRSSYSNYYEDISNNSGKQSVSYYQQIAKKTSSYNPPVDEDNVDSRKIRKQSAPPTSKTTSSSAIGSKSGSRSSSRLSNRSDSYDEDVDVRGSAQRYDSAIKAVVNTAQSPSKPRLSANRTKQPISGSGTPNSARETIVAGPNTTVAKPSRVAQEKITPEPSTSVNESRQVVGSKRPSKILIEASVTPLALFYKEISIKDITVIPEEKPVSRPKLKFIARKSGTTAIVQNSSRSEVVQKKEMPPPKPIPKKPVAQPQPKKAPPPPVYDDEEEEEDDDDDDYYKQEFEEEEEEEEEQYIPPPKKPVSKTSSSSKQPVPKQPQPKPTSKAATSRVNSEIVSSNPVDLDEQPIGVGAGKTNSMSLFEKMLEEEMRKGDAVVKTQETERKCPFCNDMISVKYFLNHKRECKEKEIKPKAKMMSFIPDELKDEAEKAKRNAKPYKKKASVWRKQHEDFLGGVSKNPRSENDEPPEDDRIQCEYCGRKFAEETHKRHVKSCGERAAKTKMKDRGSSGKATNQSISSASSTALPRKNSTSSAGSTSRQSSGLSATRSTKPTIGSSSKRY